MFFLLFRRGWKIGRNFPGEFCCVFNVKVLFDLGKIKSEEKKRKKKREGRERIWVF